MTRGSKDLISSRRMLAGGAPGEESAADRRALAARFQNPAAIRKALIHARAQGAESLVTVGDRRLFAAIGPRPSRDLPGVLPIVPNIQGFMREAVELGLAGAGVARVRRMGLPPMIGLAARGVTRLPRLLKRDFPTLLLCFIELELGEFRRYNPQTIFLQAQMTDLALAMNNPRPLLAFADAVRRLTGARLGFMTQNFARLTERLQVWGIEAGAVITPCEPSGAAMRPTQSDCESAMLAFKGDIWCDRAGRPSPPPDQNATYAQHLGLRGFLRDDDEFLGLTPVAHTNS